MKIYKWCVYSSSSSSSRLQRPYSRGAFSPKAEVRTRVEVTVLNASQLGAEKENPDTLHTRNRKIFRSIQRQFLKRGQGEERGRGEKRGGERGRQGEGRAGNGGEGDKAEKAGIFMV
jgi:hypothetical protein